jgi:hypothetical protein
MTGELDDPLIMSTVGPSKHDGGGGMSMNPEESSIGLNMGGGGETEMSIGKAGGGLGIDDSELSNNIVGVSTTVPTSKKPAYKPKDSDKKKDKKSKKNKDKKKLKAKKRAASDDSDSVGDNDSSTLKINT